MKIEKFMNKYALVIGWFFLFFMILLMALSLIKDAYALTTLNSGECKDFILNNSLTETVCAKEVAQNKINFICSPNFTIPSCPDIPKCPDPPKVEAVCSPNITAQAFTGGAEIYKDYKKYTNYLFFSLITLVLIYMFRDKIRGLRKKNFNKGIIKKDSEREIDFFGGNDGI